MGEELAICGYKLGKTLGIGTFGKVKLAVHERTHLPVAIKILNRERITSLGVGEKVRREIANLRRCVHPHIIRLYEVIYTPSDIFMVMEYVSGGELFDLIVHEGKLPEDKARYFIQQILCGVEYSHYRGVVHRDLKPENLLLDASNNIKVADFGLSNTMMDGCFLKSSCGSPNYAAPEVISGHLYAGPEVDVWSCGVILYALLCGQLPFEDESIPNLFRKIKNGHYALPPSLSQSARSLISRMLVVDPMERITIPEIRQHEFFTTRLPVYLAPLEEGKGFDKPKAFTLDPEVLERVVTLGYPGMDHPRKVAEMVTSGVHSNAVVAYDLLESTKLNQQVMAAIVEARSGRATSPLPIVRRRAPVAHYLPAAHLQRQRKWFLGIQSKKEPHHVMHEVFRALRACKFEWKIVSSFRVRCRWALPGSDPPKYVKLVHQLFRVGRGMYLLDVQLVDCDAFTFMYLCGRIITELQVPVIKKHVEEYGRMVGMRAGPGPGVPSSSRPGAPPRGMLGAPRPH